jgi:hypothetical protein
MPNKTSGFRLYLQVRIGKALRTDEAFLTTYLEGREVRIRASLGPSISKAEWLVFEARGFPTESEAHTFGERLRANVELAALCASPGVDTGLDEVLGWVHEEYGRPEGSLKPHQRRGPDVHGLLILPDDDYTVFSRSRAKGTTVSSLERFLAALRELADQPPITETALALSVRLLNLARINSEPRASIVLAVSAVESVAEDENWSAEQRDLIDKLAAGIADPEVKEAVERMHRISIRQGIKRVLESNRLDHLWEAWDDLYKRRSRLFHGGGEFTNQEIGELASNATQLCDEIIFGIIKQKGIKLPA